MLFKLNDDRSLYYMYIIMPLPERSIAITEERLCADVIYIYNIF
jgi:hypothetical protein